MARRVVPNLYGRPREGAAFFQDVLGLETAMDLGFIVTYVSPANPMVQLSVLGADPSGLQPAYSVEVEDVDTAHARAVGQGREIVYPLTDEPWGVRRFFVRDPTGAVANIVSHKAGTEQ
jgi:predicted enzyme related to lactoylglutathione lyase